MSVGSAPYVSDSFLTSTVTSGIIVPSLKFTPIRRKNREEGLRVRSDICLCDIGGAYTYPTAGNSMIYTQSGASISYEWLWPASPDYFTRSQEFIASAFSKYRMMRCVFHYRPTNASTNSAISLTFAASEDPEHPSILAATAARMQNAGGFRFPPWQAWDWELPLTAHDDLLDMYGYTTTIAANVRQFAAGAFACVLNNGSVTLGGSLGQLWATIDWELYDLQPAYTSVSVSLEGKEKVTPRLPGQVLDHPHPPDLESKYASQPRLEILDILTGRVSQLVLQPEDTSVAVNLTVNPSGSVSTTHHEEHFANDDLPSPQPSVARDDRNAGKVPATPSGKGFKR